MTVYDLTALVPQQAGDMTSVGDMVSRQLGLRVKYDNSVTLGENFVAAIRRGTKTHTIKFHQEGGYDVVRLPMYRRLPLIEKLGGNAAPRMVAHLDFDRVTVRRYGELSEEDAIDDGFPDEILFRSETEALAKQRGFNLTPQSWVSAYHFERVHWV